MLHRRLSLIYSLYILCKCFIFNNIHLINSIYKSFRHTYLGLRTPYFIGLIECIYLCVKIKLTYSEKKLRCLNMSDEHPIKKKRHARRRVVISKPCDWPEPYRSHKWISREYNPIIDRYYHAGKCCCWVTKEHLENILKKNHANRASNLDKIRGLNALRKLKLETDPAFRAEYNLKSRERAQKRKKSKKAPLIPKLPTPAETLKIKRASITPEQREKKSNRSHRYYYANKDLILERRVDKKYKKLTEILNLRIKRKEKELPPEEFAVWSKKQEDYLGIQYARDLSIARAKAASLSGIRTLRSSRDEDSIVNQALTLPTREDANEYLNTHLAPIQRAEIGLLQRRRELRRRITDHFNTQSSQTTSSGVSS